MNTDFYYSEKDKNLFMILPNYREDNTSSIVEHTKVLLERAKRLADFIGRPIEDVNGQLIESSRRYKRMYLYYIKNIESGNVPKHTFRLNNHTMLEWARD